MSVELKTYAGSNVTPQNDAIKDDFNTLSNGIYYGCTVTIKDATTLHITAGQGIVYGRVFEIVDDDISVSLAPSGTLLGQLYLHIDLANLSAPAQLLVETGASLTPMVDDDQININSGITEMQLATFDVSTVTISNLVSTAPNARGAKDIEQTIGNTNISGIGDGTVTGAIADLNANLSIVEDSNGVLKRVYLISETFPANTAYQVVQFPANKFTVAPYVIGSTNRAGFDFEGATNITASSCMVYIREGGGSVPTSPVEYTLLCIGN